MKPLIIIPLLLIGFNVMGQEATFTDAPSYIDSVWSTPGRDTIYLGDYGYNKDVSSTYQGISKRILYQDTIRYYYSPEESTKSTITIILECVEIVLLVFLLLLYRADKK